MMVKILTKGKTVKNKNIPYINMVRHLGRHHNCLFGLFSIIG